MTVNPDAIAMSSILPQFVNTNPAPITAQLVMFGNKFPPAFSHTFSQTISYPSGANWINLYASNSNTNLKQLVSQTGFPAIWQNAGGELAQQYITYGTNSLTYNLVITNNTAGNISLIDQNFNFELVMYQLPF